MELKTIYGNVIFALEGATTVFQLVRAALDAKKSLRGANLRGADLRGANLYGANLRGANLYGKKIEALKVFTGLYCHEVWAVLYSNGQRWVRMGCLFKTLDEWEAIGIRDSNEDEFPNDGSDKCEERAAAFEFAKAAVLRMKLPVAKEVVA